MELTTTLHQLLQLVLTGTLHQLYCINYCKRELTATLQLLHQLLHANLASFPGPVRKSEKGPGSTSVYFLSLM